MTTAEELATLRARALERANALADSWASDPTLVTRSSAADLFASVLELSGWEQGNPEPAPLRLVTDRSSR
ncbi:hypothetical protein ACIOD1_12835 [Streptomyces sp. NPDC088097]|uniref:hypothetical protein n=1 Tax=Streptomyces sp. NPDC088097 TaxID=3365823 RepID=UPI00382BFBE5